VNFSETKNVDIPEKRLNNELTARVPLIRITSTQPMSSVTKRTVAVIKTSITKE